ncbi:methyltransferase domain-containing protein [Chloroflexota bacterium]
MDIRECINTWKQEEEITFSGWNFSHLMGRMILEQTPWSYSKLAIDLMHKYSSVIDMGTGGGEWILQHRKYWPEKVVATEGYTQNFKLASERLSPLGVKVIDFDQSVDSLMPFDDNEFGLAINRHSAFNCEEVSRIMVRGGTFLTEQIHGLFAHELLSAFDNKPQFPEATLEFYVPELVNAGFAIVNKQDWSGKLKFTDVGAIVYYLKAVPWLVPGFSVDTHLDHLIAIQRKLEDGNDLVFTAREYMIEARKD